MKKVFNYEKLAGFLLILNIVFIFSGFCYTMLTPTPAHAATPVKPEMNESCFPGISEPTETISHNHSGNTAMPCCVEKQDHGTADVSLQSLDFLKLPFVLSLFGTPRSNRSANNFSHLIINLSPPEQPHLESIVLRI